MDPIRHLMRCRGHHIGAQTRRVLDNVSAVLKSEGLSLANVLKMKSHRVLINSDFRDRREAKRNTDLLSSASPESRSLHASALEDRTGAKKAPTPIRSAGAVQKAGLMTRQPKLLSSSHQ